MCSRSFQTKHRHHVKLCKGPFFNLAGFRKTCTIRVQNAKFLKNSGGNSQILICLFLQHFLCNPGVSIPRINLTFSAEELEDSAERTRVYVGHMRALARQKTVSRREKVWRMQIGMGNKKVFWWPCTNLVQRSLKEKTKIYSSFTQIRSCCVLTQFT